MNNLKILVFFLLFFSLISINFAGEDKLEIFSPKYFNEQTNIYNEIHYLNNELLSFKFCSEKSKDISFELICNNETKELKIFEYESEKDCYFTNYKLKNLKCENPELKINYSVNNKKKQITRNFKSQKQSLLINHVISKDYTKLNPEELSYYLIVLNDIQDKNSKNNKEIYEKLKNNRDNKNKCWPNNDCNIETTTNILRNLKFSNYNLNTRMLEDGKNYIEKNLINNENNPLKFEIEIDHDFDNNEEISCDLTIDDDDERTYEFDENSENSELTIIKEASSNIEFRCNTTIDNINFRLYNIDDNLNIDKDNKDVNSISEDLTPFSCIGENECEYYPSINALTIYGSSIKDSNLIENYVDTLILEFNSESFVNYKDKIIDSSKYLNYKNNEGLIDYIKYIQNNDGSWGTTNNYNKIIPSAWSILGLQSATRESEYITDGKKWIYYNEPISGWGNIEKNTLAYLAIKDKLKPYLKIDSVNEIKNITNFEIENPTIYELKNIKITFNDEINNYLSYTQDLGELKGEDKIKFSIKVNDDFFGTKSGEMIISGIDGKNKELQLIEMPINIVGKELFTITQKNLALSDDETKLKLEISSTIPNYNFRCSYENPFTKTKEEVLLIYPLKDITILDPQQTIGEYLIEFECSSENIEQFKTKFNLKVIKTNKTLEVLEPEKIISGTKDFSINILNINPDKQIIELSIEGDLKNIITPSENTKVIAKNETREIYFTISNPELLNSYINTSNSFIVIQGENNYIKKIPLKIALIPEKEGLSLIWYITIILIVIISIIFVIRRYRYLQEQEKIEQNSNNNEDNMMFEDLEFEE